jgi:hypothetical protein
MSRRPVDPRPDKNFWTAQHRRTANLPLAWSGAALGLHRGTALLWDLADTDRNHDGALRVGDPVPASLIPVTMLLAALTVELWLKAIYVKSKPAFDSAGRFRLKTHKLLDLAQQTTFSLDSGEEDLLERLEAFLEWACRYPVPLDATDLLPRTTNTGGFAPLSRTSSNDRAIWERLIERLRAAA